MASALVVVMGVSLREGGCMGACLGGGGLGGR